MAHNVQRLDSIAKKGQPKSETLRLLPPPPTCPVTVGVAFRLQLRLATHGCAIPPESMPMSSKQRSLFFRVYFISSTSDQCSLGDVRPQVYGTLSHPRYRDNQRDCAIAIV